MTALHLIALALAAPAPTAASPAEACATARIQHALESRKPGVQRGSPPSGRKLGELPPGSLELAVVRKVDDCAIRAIVRTGYGGR